MSSPEQNNQDGAPEEKGTAFSRFLPADRKVIALLVFLFLVLMIIRWIYLSGAGLSPVEIDRASPVELQYQLEINQATWIEWVQLEGIGETLARKIVDYREKNGPFKEIDNLLEVNGIGAKTLEKFRPWIRIENPKDPHQKQAASKEDPNES